MYTKLLSTGLLMGGLLMIGAGCSTNSSTLAPATSMENEKAALTKPTTDGAMMASDTAKNDTMMPKDTDANNGMMVTTSAMQKTEDGMQPAVEKPNTMMNDTDNMKK